MKRLTLLALACTAVACSIDEDDFPAEYAETWCDRVQECEPDAFENIYDDDLEECEDLNTDAVEIWLDFADLGGETYDGAKGYECVKETKKASCDELEDGDVSCDLWADE